jgi:hypothetical protein
MQLLTTHLEATTHILLEAVVGERKLLEDAPY